VGAVSPHAKGGCYPADTPDMNIANTTDRLQYRQQRHHLAFPIRVRVYGSDEPWQVGTGIDLSIAGLTCLLPVSPPPAVGMIYEIEFTLYFPDCPQERLQLQATVQGSLANPQGSQVWLQVIGVDSRTKIARTILEL
jgi:hypothetical protein